MTENLNISFLSLTLGKPVFHVEISISVEYSDIRKLLFQTIIYLHPQIFDGDTRYWILVIVPKLLKSTILVKIIDIFTSGRNFESRRNF